MRRNLYFAPEPSAHRVVQPSADYNQVLAPKVLSLRDNPEEVIRFISRLRSHFDRMQPVFVDLREVTRIEIDGIAILLSVLVRFKAKRIRINGSYPQDPGAKLALEKSKFFEMLSGKIREQRAYNLETGGSIATHAKLKVDSDLANELVKSASAFVWGRPRHCKGIYRTLQELMLNTHNHAEPGREGFRQWWLATKHIQSESKVAFSFIDYGVGIFESLRSAGHPLRAIIDFLKLDRDVDVLEAIFTTDLHKTSSGKYYRGKGLKGIFAAMQKGDFSSFVLISNRVMYDGRANEYRELENSLQGTFVYWELGPTNRSVE